MTAPNAHIRVLELQTRAQQAKTREEARAILAEAELIYQLDKRLRN
jgi:hypothetical protein